MGSQSSQQRLVTLRGYRIRHDRDCPPGNVGCTNATTTQRACVRRRYTSVPGVRSRGHMGTRTSCSTQTGRVVVLGTRSSMPDGHDTVVAGVAVMALCNRPSREVANVASGAFAAPDEDGEVLLSLSTLCRSPVLPIRTCPRRRACHRRAIAVVYQGFAFTDHGEVCRVYGSLTLPAHIAAGSAATLHLHNRTFAALCLDHSLQ